MRRLFALAIFCSATLLFLVQPLAGKILLPVLGGSPAVWSTCILFFQAVLFVGYLYAHALSTRVASRWQGPVHVGVIVAASLMLPVPIEMGEPGETDPRWWALGALASAVGLPFFALSATAPLLQHWFSRTGDPKAKDPYFLYATSNAGSLLGLLAYPLVEPFATRSLQGTAWSVGFWACGALVAASAYASIRPVPSPRTVVKTRLVSVPPVTWAQRVLWIALALVPSALLLGVTQHLSTDVVSAPLLWVVPLALYLLTFMAAFSTRRVGSARRWGSVAPLAALLVLVLALADVRYPILPITLVHLTAFTVLAMLCHTRLAESRPDPLHLTGYFVCVSLGGMLGSVTVVVAPIVFSSILEYPLAIAAALLLRPQTVDADRRAGRPSRRWIWRAAAAVLFVVGYWCVSTFNGRTSVNPSMADGTFTWLQSVAGGPEGADRAVRALLVIPAALLLLTPRTALVFAGTAAGLLVGSGTVRTGGEVLHRERTFFGVHQVTSIQNGDWHVLTHGTTTHGVQAVRGKVRLLPTAYYHPSGPIGDVVFTLSPEGRFRDVAVVGLGAGALAAYAGTGTRMDLFEVDEAVIRIAEDPRYFTYLAEAKARPGANVRTRAVDGRLGLQAMPQSSYDLIVIDAFSSDAIPTHLLTREAVAMYVSRLKSRGVIAFHVSSRFFDLRPVLARIGEDRGLVAYARDDKDIPPERATEAMRASVWVVLARDSRDLGQIAAAPARWARIVAGAQVPLWTDDYSSVIGALWR